MIALECAREPEDGPMKTSVRLLVLLLLVAVAVGGLIWSGAYDIAADDPHWRLTEETLEMVRDRSIEARASGVEVPDLANESLVRAGAGNYDAMCERCHLEPGEQRSELSLGLNPAPPNLTKDRIDDPAEAFWVIKHGIKMTGMPAFGPTHDEATIWSMVSFLQKIDELTPEQKRALAQGGDEEAEHH